MSLRIKCAGLLVTAFVQFSTCPAQDLPALAVSPSKVNMLIGETRVFRAVGKDGRIRHNVHWSIAPEHATALTQDGDEATVEAREVSSRIILTATAEGDSADASIDILPGKSLQSGTVIWSVTPLPGCKSEKLIQAVPTATGPDLYDQETCPQGSVIRAMTADGREIWRRALSGSGVPPVQLTRQGTVEQPAQRLNLHGTSACDSVSPGMPREEVGRILADRNVHVDEKQRSSSQWLIEEEGFRCTISFDAGNGTVVKKKKTVVTD